MLALEGPADKVPYGIGVDGGEVAVGVGLDEGSASAEDGKSGEG